MISVWFKNCTPQMQGNIVLAIGAILLLNSLDMVRGLNALIILVSVTLVWYGFIEAGYWNWVKNFFQRIQK